MALPILDGNQSATTLSSILTSGEHIPAHTVVSLGTQAITDMQSAVSGSVVSIPSLPAISGTVTATGFDPAQGISKTIPVVRCDNGIANNQDVVPVVIGIESGSVNSFNPLPISGTVTIGNTVTIAGTVTANPTGTQTIAGTVTANLSNVVTSNTFWGGNAIMITGEAGKGLLLGGIDSNNNPANIYEGGGVPVIPRESCPSFPISGTVTANIGNSSAVSAGFVKICGEVAGGAPSDPKEIITDSQGMLYARIAPSNSLTSDPVKYDPVLGDAYINVRQYTGTSVTISSLPAISGTVTASNIQNIFGTSEIYVTDYDTDTKFSSANPFPISGTVTVGNSVTIGSLPAISGTVTANTFAVQGTAVTTSNFTSTTASTVLANYNATRQVLTIFNEGAGNLHICAGATCTTAQYQVRLSSGDYYEVPNHQTTITHSAVFATAGTARVTEVS
jgi:hypothetical protein